MPRSRRALAAPTQSGPTGGRFVCPVPPNLARRTILRRPCVSLCLVPAPSSRGGSDLYVCSIHIGARSRANFPGKQQARMLLLLASARRPSGRWIPLEAPRCSMLPGDAREMDSIWCALVRSQMSANCSHSRAPNVTRPSAQVPPTPPLPPLSLALLMLLLLG